MNQAREGFTLVEVVIAVVLLTAGLLAVAGGTGHMLTQMSLADARTERMAAIQNAAAQVRATDYDLLATKCSNGSLVTGRYTVTCTTSQVSTNLKQVYVISTGPGLHYGRIRDGVVDTFVINIAKPVQ